MRQKTTKIEHYFINLRQKQLLDECHERFKLSIVLTECNGFISRIKELAVVSIH